MTCRSPAAAGAALGSGSMTISSRGRCAGRWPRLTRALPSVRDAVSVASAFSSCGFAGGDRGLQVLEPEVELVLAQTLRLAPEVVAAELSAACGSRRSL